MFHPNRLLLLICESTNKKGAGGKPAPFLYSTRSSVTSSSFKLITWLVESRPMVTP